MKTSITLLGMATCCLVAVEFAKAQTSVAVSDLVRGKVVLANPQTKVMTVLVEPGSTPIDFYGLERARIEMSGGRLGTLAELRPGLPVAVYYSVLDGRWYPQRILIPDANLAVPLTPLTSAENKALESKAANDGDITTNPGVKARIDRDITTQPGKKDPAVHDITKKGN